MPPNKSPTLTTSPLPSSLQKQDRFGVDVVTYPSLDPSFRLLQGIQVLAERLYRRFTTPKNFLTFQPGDGLDLRSFLSKAMTNREVQALKAQVEKEARKDQQVDDATATVVFNQSAESLTIALSVEPSDESSFTLTMGVTALDVTLLSVAPS